MRASKKRRDRVIEQLRLEIIFPAKSQFNGRRRAITVINSNRRFLGECERSFWDWDELFDSVGLDLLDEVDKLVKQEIGSDCIVDIHEFEGHLGVTSNTSLIIRRKKLKKKRG